MKPVLRAGHLVEWLSVRLTKVNRLIQVSDNSASSIVGNNFIINDSFYKVLTFVEIVYTINNCPFKLYFKVSLYEARLLSVKTIHSILGFHVTS